MKWLLLRDVKQLIPDATETDKVVVLTQAEYDALGTYDPDTYYAIAEA